MSKFAYKPFNDRVSREPDPFPQNDVSQNSEKLDESRDRTPMGIPVDYSGDPRIMMALPVPPTENPSKMRVWEIDYLTKNGFGCYRCFLWCCYLRTIIKFIMDVMTLWSNGMVSAIQIVDPIIALLSVFAFFNGILAMKQQSIRKNEIFRKLLLCIIALESLLLVYYLAFGKPTVRIFDNPNKEHANYKLNPNTFDINPIVLTVYFIVLLCVNIFAYRKSRQVDKLLYEKLNLVHQTV
jgi:hypothetical protein